MYIKLPVEYTMYGTVTVEADTIEEAIKKFNENNDDFDLPDDPEYVDGSFICSDDINFIKFVNK